MPRGKTDKPKYREAKDAFMRGFEIDGIFEYKPTLKQTAEKVGISIGYLRNVASSSGGGTKDRQGSTKEGWHADRRRHHATLGIDPEEERCRGLVQQAKVNRDVMLKEQLDRLTKIEKRYDELFEAGKNEPTNRDIMQAMHQKRLVMTELLGQNTTPLEQHTTGLVNLGIVIQTKEAVGRVEVVDVGSGHGGVVQVPPVPATHRSE